MWLLTDHVRMRKRTELDSNRLSVDESCFVRKLYIFRVNIVLEKQWTFGPFIHYWTCICYEFVGIYHTCISSFCFVLFSVENFFENARDWILLRSTNAQRRGSNETYLTVPNREKPQLSGFPHMWLSFVQKFHISHLLFGREYFFLSNGENKLCLQTDTRWPRPPRRSTAMEMLECGLLRITNTTRFQHSIGSLRSAGFVRLKKEVKKDDDEEYLKTT